MGGTASLQGVTYGVNGFVAVGYDYETLGGVILTSADGSAWTVRTPGATAPLMAAAYGNGVFVAVGEGGAILSSPDGITWTARTSGMTRGNLWGAAYGNGIFAAVGYDTTGFILTSSDGIKWTKKRINVYPTGIAYGGTVRVTMPANPLSL
jgi:hypothetical protein